MDESALAILLQDINPKDIKIYNKNKLLIELFKKHFEEKISTLVQLDTNTFLKTIYQNKTQVFTKKNWIDLLIKHYNQNDVYHIKENLYNIDFWINESYCDLAKEQLTHQNIFDAKSILQIYAQHRETLL